jgi:hypothetical protein
MESMTEMADQPTFGLDSVLEALRSDLLAAQRGASSGNVGLTIKDAEVELAFTVEAKAGGGGQVNLKVFGVGLGGGLSKERSDSSVHRIKITLVPLPGSDRAIAGGQRSKETEDQASG